MWKENWIACFFRQIPSSSTASAHSPLIREASHPNYRALDSVPELNNVDGREHQSCHVGEPGVSAATNGLLSPAIPVSISTSDAKLKKTSPRPNPPAVTGPDDAPAQVIYDVEAIHPSGKRSIRSFFMEELDTVRAIAPLSAYCFMTGFMDAISFSATFVWCAFQTGNSLQLSFAVARLVKGHAFYVADQQALCAVLCFIFGAFIGRFGDKIGCKTRAWMTLGTFLQTLFTMAAAITIWKGGSGGIGEYHEDPAWSHAVSFVTLGFMSASMGLQGIMGKRLNTQFTTTVVLTSTWCELVTEPQLFDFRHLVPARDHKIMAISFLFLGGFTGRILLDEIGSAGVLCVGAALRFIIALWWLLVPAKKTQ